MIKIVLETAEKSTTMGDAPKPAPIKRPLFNQPTWSKPKATQNSTDFFDRSSQVLARVAIDDELKRKRKPTRKQQERTDSRHEEQDGKRRRPSYGEKEERGNHSSSFHTNGTLKEQGQARSRLTSPSTKSLIPTTSLLSSDSLTQNYEKTVTAAAKASKHRVVPKVIDLEGSEDSGHGKDSEKDNDLQIIAVTKPKDVTYDDFPASDEEFPELARKAREKARRKRLEADSEAIATPDPPASTGRDDSYRQPVQTQQHPPMPPLPDPVVSLLITSRIPNTNPLIVNRRLSQRLKDVRLAWCQRQQFTAEATQNVILTWRGKRLFDVSSCKSLGIGVDAKGNIVLKGEKDIFGEADRQIHLEAMTEETFKEMRKAKEHVEEEEIAEDMIEETDGRMSEQANQEQQIRIILKAKELKEFKLIVKPVGFVWMID